MQPRDYQSEQVEAIEREWRVHPSTLLVAATGLGKTSTFLLIAKRARPHRTLILAHRRELIFQARERAAQMGLTCGIEMAEHSVCEGLFDKPDIVVSTVQTQLSRKHKWNPNDFGRLIIDEAHTSTSASYSKVLAHYRQNAALKILGVTATPDRADQRALGQIYASVAHVYDIVQAIQDGWLVPIRQQIAMVRNLDFSRCRTTAGDLNAGDVAKQIEQEEILHRIASPTAEAIGDKQTILFAQTVKQARGLQKLLLERYKKNFGFVCAETPKDERDSILGDYKAKRIQGVCNVAVLTEGFDAPLTEVVVMAFPTLSRNRYAQCVGRSTRPLPGVVDGRDSAEARKVAIALSPKPYAVILDFCGNAGRHKLVTCGDILGGKAFDDTLERYKKKARENGCPVDVLEMLNESELEMREEARQRAKEKELEQAKRLSHISAKADFSIREVPLQGALFCTSTAAKPSKTILPHERNTLLKCGYNPDTMPYWEAKKTLKDLYHRWKHNLLTPKQEDLLKRVGYRADEVAVMTKKQASAAIDAAKNNNWRRPNEHRERVTVSH